MKAPQPIYGTRSNGLLRSMNGVIRDGASPTIHMPNEHQDYGKKEGGSPRTVLVQSVTDTPTHNITNNSNHKQPLHSQVTIINNSVVNATTSNQSETSSIASSVQNNPSINTAAQGAIVLDNRNNLIIKKIHSSDDHNQTNNSASDDNCSESEQQQQQSTASTAPPSSSSSNTTSVNDSTTGYRGSNNTVIISNRLNQHTHHLNTLQSQYLISEPTGSILPSAPQLHIPHHPTMPPYTWPFDLSTKPDISEKSEMLSGIVLGGSNALFETIRSNNIALYNVGEAGLLNHAATNVNDIIDDTLKDYNQEEQHGQHEEANYLTLNSNNGDTESRSPLHQEDMNFVQLQTVSQMNPIIENDYEHENG